MSHEYHKCDHTTRSDEDHIKMHVLMRPFLTQNQSIKMKHFRDLVLTCTCIWISFSARCFSQLQPQPQPQPQQGPQVPCFFILGDSLVDNGNNNGILTLARANYRPYGIDFPQGATGRFTNGRTYVDALGKALCYN